MATVSPIIGTLTIASSGTDSNVLSSPILRQARALVFDTGSGAFTGTVTVYGSHNAGGTTRALDVQGTAVTLTGQRMQVWNAPFGIRDIQIKSGSAEAAERNVLVYAYVESN